jgi:hypothetical protein
MANPMIYTVGGTVQAGGGIYIKRKVDDQLLALCRQAEIVLVLSSRQVGKSSLMVSTAEQLELDKICSVIIDLSGLGTKLEADQWYLGILDAINYKFEFKTNIFKWWKDHQQLGATKRLVNFFRDVLLKEVHGPVVLFFDEIDSTLSIDFSDDFFAALRAIYNERSTAAEFRRLSFVLVGVATPSDLIKDKTRTPFNIGYRLDLEDFSLEEAAPLANGFGGELQVLKWIFNWTGGHPYLTQKVCKHFYKRENITESEVTRAVSSLFLGKKELQDDNLKFVRDMLIERSKNDSDGELTPYSVLSTYQEIFKGKGLRDDELSKVKNHLKISGIVRKEDDLLIVRNAIYREVFNLSWINQNLSTFIFKGYAVGGAVQASGGTYIKRKADDELLTLCRQSESALITSPRQVGKSSLLVNTAQQLKRENIRAGITDLSAIGTQVSAREWLLGILNELTSSLDLEIDVFRWWEVNAELEATHLLVSFFQNVVLKEVKEQVVLFFDEVDTLLYIPYAYDLLEAIHAVHNNRSVVPDFRRLSFVLSGVATLNDLITGNNRAMLNIGNSVELNDFTFEEAQPLMMGLPEDAEKIFRRVYDWTSGHPYLTQRLCAYLSLQGRGTDVDRAVNALFLGTQVERDSNLLFVQDSILRHSPDVRMILRTYSDILSGYEVNDDKSIIKTYLKLSGIVRELYGKLVPRNQIYRRVFDLEWIKKHTPPGPLHMIWSRNLVLTFPVRRLVYVIVTLLVILALIYWAFVLL